ncbi:phospholipase [Microbacterium mitrae]|uniref:Phospholipase n=1 Tax=Microbacterium mitrae TaxID=664640 RepID=A0A5C8HL85_9MICO|nr:phospholipase [Microbacterium mitrae]
MSFSSHTSRPQPPAPSKRRASIALVGALVALGTLGASAPAVAAGLVPPVRQMLPAVELTELRAATDAADAAVADADAANAEVAASGLTIATPAVDAQQLREYLADSLTVTGAADEALTMNTAQLVAATEEVVTATSTIRADLLVTAQRVAAEQAAAEQAAAEAAAAEALAAANTPDGARATAESIALNDYGWGSDQFACLESLWSKESGWNYQAENSSSGAYGIPQSLPGSKMATVADDWATNATTQIIWGLQYIDAVYGSPCGAWSHSQATNWY